MAVGKIPVGVNIIASEQVTKVFDKVSSSIQKVFAAINKGPKAATAALKETTNAVQLADNSVNPDKKDKKKDKDSDIDVNGGGFGSLQKPAKAWASGVEGMAGAIKNFMLLLVGSGGITYGIKKFSDNISDSVIDMKRLGNRVGLPTKDIRELGFIARAASIPISTLNQSLVSLSDAQFDKKFHVPSESIKSFDALNSRLKTPISLLNPDGTRRNLKALFLDVVKGVGEINDPSLKARVASSLLGGEESLKLTDMGDKRLDALSNHFKITPFPKNLEEDAYRYNTAVSDIDASLEKIKVTAGADILKGFTQGLEKSGHLISQNTDGIKKMSESLGEKIPKAIPAIFTGLDSIATTLERVNNSVGLVNIAMVVLGTYTIAKTINLIGDLTKAITVLKAASIFTNPAVSAVTSALATAAPVAAVAAAAVVVPYVLTKGVGAISEKLGIGLPKNEPMISASAWRTGIIPDDTSPPKKPQPQEHFVRIVFDNSPAGMRVIEKNSSSSNFLIDLGLNLAGAH